MNKRIELWNSGPGVASGLDDNILELREWLGLELLKVPVEFRESATLEYNKKAKAYSVYYERPETPEEAELKPRIDQAKRKEYFWGMLLLVEVMLLAGVLLWLFFQF